MGWLFYSGNRLRIRKAPGADFRGLRYVSER